MNPPAQRNPSPNGAPAPPATSAFPWKYMHVESVMPLPLSTIESAETLGVPLASSLPAVPFELRQPAFSPGVLSFAHGHGVPRPSPKQIGIEMFGRGMRPATCIEPGTPARHRSSVTAASAGGTSASKRKL